MKNILILIILIFSINVSFAKGSSFSSSRSSSFSSSKGSSFSSSKSSSSSFKVNQSSQSTIKLIPSTTGKLKASSFNDIKTAKDYKQVYNEYKQSFNKPKFSYDDLKKYQNIPKTERRKSFYSAYTPKYYSSNYNNLSQFNISPSYGAWDGFLMWSLLDNVGDSMMYYHHMNDPAFQQWRSEANQLAQTDPDVKNKLNQLDAKIKEMENEGIPRDNMYITPGIDPDIYEAEIDKTKLPKIKFCAGSISGDYYSIGFLINQKTKINIEDIKSNSSRDNIEKVNNGECDIGVTQADIYNELKPQNIDIIGELKTESSILACNSKSGVLKTSNLKKSKIYVGNDETGSQFTLDHIQQNSQDFKYTNFIPKQSILEAIESAKNDKDGCVFTITDPNAKIISKITKDKLLRLVTIDVPIEKLKSSYIQTKIPRSDFEKGFFVWLFGGNISMISTGTELIINKEWKERNKHIYDIILLELDNIRSII